MSASTQAIDRRVSRDLRMSGRTGTLEGKEKLAHMANQVALFFGSALPHDEAVVGIADHLNSFWEPRLRRQVVEMACSGGHELGPLVIEAASKLRIPPASTASKNRG
jgi:formate dehydrogenase subunit delta